MIDQKAIEEHIRGILVALGDDPEREGLKDTPKRVAKMYAEVFAGMNYSNHEIAEMFDKTFEEGIADEEDHVSLTIPEDDSERADLTAVVGKNGHMASASSPEDSKPARVVVMKDIDFFSYCEHHMALMYDMKVSVAYIPRGRVIGLSKIARVCDMVGKRLQLQERIGEDIADIITEITGSEDVAVTIVGCHSCMSARGIRKEQAKTFTTELRGQFRENPNLMFYLK